MSTAVAQLIEDYLDNPMEQKDFQLLLKISEDITRNQAKLENIDKSLLAFATRINELERKVDKHEEHIQQQRGFKSGSTWLVGLIGALLGIIGGVIGMYLSII